MHDVHRNLAPAVLYEHAIRFVPLCLMFTPLTFVDTNSHDPGSVILSSGNESQSQSIAMARGSHCILVLTIPGALSVLSGAKTGRSPKDKRVVDEPSSSSDVNWGNNKTLTYFEQ